MNSVPMLTLNDGNTIPQLGLGVWKAADGQEVENAVSAALASGYRLIDTAAVYKNEAGVGSAIKNSGIPREDIFVTTKLWNSDQGTGKVRRALQDSLEKLDLDYIDLYLIHWPMPARGLYVETWKELETLRDEGLIRSIGVSNFHIEHLEELKKHSNSIPVVNQVELHPHFQQHELREYAKNNNIHIESWSPLGGSKGNLMDNAALIAIANSHSKSTAQIMIRWHLQNDLIVIPKSTNSERIAQNIDVFDFELSKADMATINAIHSGERSGPDPENMNLH